MKRGAERQITKDGPDDDDDIEEIQDPQGFQKAEESALAKREIRALPKRALAASRPPSVNGLPLALAPDGENVEATSQPKFAGFAGFGAGASVSNSFTFTAHPPHVSLPAPSLLDATFKSTQSTSTPNPILPSPSLGAPNSFPSDIDVDPPKPGKSSPSEEVDAIALKYFKSLRGLNTSFVSAISAAVKKDPFLDVVGLVESYKNLRTTIQSEFDGSLQLFALHSPVPTNSTPPFGVKAPPEKTPSFSMPKLPVGLTEVSSRPPSTSENGTKTNVTFLPFLPPSGSTPMALSFATTSKPSEPSISSSTTSPEPPKSAFTFTTSNTSDSTVSPPSTSGFPFATSSSIENTASKSVAELSSQESASSTASPSSQPTSTASSLGSGSVPTFFVSTKPTSAFGTSDAAFKPISVFGSSIFGSSGTTESTKPSLFNPVSSDSKDSPKPTTLCSHATTTSPSLASTFGSSDKPVSFFGSASSPKGSAFTFGKPGGSIGNPVGFGFGSFAPGAGDTTTPGPSSSGFIIGVPPTKSSERLFSPPVTDKSSESTPQPEVEGNEEGGEEEGAKSLPAHSHDEEGEGEEDEETTHVMRCKVYRLSKSPEDKSEWKDLGIGMFRLKKHKETDVRRVLVRNSNTGRILINFRIYGSLKPSLAKTSVSFIGYENSAPTSFRIRVKTEEQAGDLKQAIEREIAAVRGAE